ncbi:DUF2927 domain-containing protein [Tabrizicola sp.]|uniref:DUF2927 domain-containing protein n=1 Tax=Tabrizicola sp. TaxID=2005166 RepID=UPI0026108C0F|nr:DUF2927 domain-containing protein [Tabrizicola sp.]MDM7932820.1 DUF2927 domain-containing protein [Tabrizicola sp.]
MARHRTLRTFLAGIACLALTACTIPGGPPAGPAIPTAPAPAVPTEKSATAAAYYAQVQKALLAQGLLRTDSGANIPFTDRMLADSFLRIALFDEYRRSSSGFVREETESRLRRWEVSVRVGLRFGASVPPDRQTTDRARVASYLARLSQVTGHPIAIDETAPNFLIHIVSEDEREALGPKVRAAIPSLGPNDVAGITNMPRSTYCLVYALSEGNSGAYTRAFAVIRAEHPDLLRLSCMHEEIAQALGLPNDSPRARPSIFNDDEEFALLTDKDELMLRMLYSRELRPGMTLSEARPIVYSLARRLMGGDS